MFKKHLKITPGHSLGLQFMNAVMNLVLIGVL